MLQREKMYYRLLVEIKNKDEMQVEYRDNYISRFFIDSPTEFVGLI